MSCRFFCACEGTKVAIFSSNLEVIWIPSANEVWNILGKVEITEDKAG